MKERVFFSGLNELRGIAAMAVVIHHIELFKFQDGGSVIYQTPLRNFAEDLGKNGVYLFFVLSGFLITYLLLTELKRNGTISAGKFYMRRIVRIWPLYYSIILVSFFVLPELTKIFPALSSTFFGERLDVLYDDFYKKLLLYLFFLPNLGLVMYTPISGSAQAWSVGVEEQFYLLWPQLLKLFKNHVFVLLLSVIVFKFALYYGLTYVNASMKSPELRIALRFFASFKIELMAIGGLGAYALINGYLDRFYIIIPKASKWLLLAGIIFLLIVPVSILLLGVLFLFLILMNINDRHHLFRNRFFSFLGDISYGIYMIHPLVMFFTFVIINSWIRPESSFVYNLLVYSITIALTILISYLSFRYFESFFLKLKERFVLVPSGKNR